MEVSAQRRFEVGEASAAGDVRRAAVDLARELDFGEADAGRVGIVATEAATNLVKHGGGGEVLLCDLQKDGARGRRHPGARSWPRHGQRRGRHA